MLGFKTVKLLVTVKGTKAYNLTMPSIPIWFLLGKNQREYGIACDCCQHKALVIYCILEDFDLSWIAFYIDWNEECHLKESPGQPYPPIV